MDVQQHAGLVSDVVICPVEVGKNLIQLLLQVCCSGSGCLQLILSSCELLLKPIALLVKCCFCHQQLPLKVLAGVVGFSHPLVPGALLGMPNSPEGRAWPAALPLLLWCC